ncbi:MAG TPA: hypothetical protein VF516_15135 [Kofleriaceae bacterium]
MVRFELGPRFVPFSGTRAPGLPPGAASLAAPPEQLLLNVPLSVALPLRRHASFVTTIALTVN